MEYIRICAFCGKEFIAHKSNTRYCSTLCSKRQYKDKWRRKNRKETEERDIEEIVGEYTKKEILTLKEATIYLGVSRTTLYRYIRSGMIPRLQLCGTVRVRRSDIDHLFSIALPYTRKERATKIAEERTDVTRDRNERPDNWTFISRAEACNILGVCSSTAAKLFKKHNVECVTFGCANYYNREQIERLAKRRERNEYPEITEWMTREEIQKMFSMSECAVYTLVSDKGIPRKTDKGCTVLYSRQHVYEAKHVGIDFEKDYYTAEYIMQKMGINRCQLHNRLKRGKIPRITVNRTLWIKKSEFIAVCGRFE